MGTVDPVFQPWQSPYNSMDGDPININDVLGRNGNKANQGSGITFSTKVKSGEGASQVYKRTSKDKDGNLLFTKAEFAAANKSVGIDDKGNLTNEETLHTGDKITLPSTPAMISKKNKELRLAAKKRIEDNLAKNKKAKDDAKNKDENNKTPGRSARAKQALEAGLKKPFKTVSIDGEETEYEYRPAVPRRLVYGVKPINTTPKSNLDLGLDLAKDKLTGVLGKASPGGYPGGFMDF